MPVRIGHEDGFRRVPVEVAAVARMDHEAGQGNAGFDPPFLWVFAREAGAVQMDVESDQSRDRRFVATTAGAGIDTGIDIVAGTVHPDEIGMKVRVLARSDPEPANLVAADGPKLDEVVGGESPEIIEHLIELLIIRGLAQQSS